MKLENGVSCIIIICSMFQFLGRMTIEICIFVLQRDYENLLVGDDEACAKAE